MKDKLIDELIEKVTENDSELLRLILKDIMRGIPDIVNDEEYSSVKNHVFDRIDKEIKKLKNE